MVMLAVQNDTSTSTTNTRITSPLIISYHVINFRSKPNALPGWLVTWNNCICCFLEVQEGWQRVSVQTDAMHMVCYNSCPCPCPCPSVSAFSNYPQVYTAHQTFLSTVLHSVGSYHHLIESHQSQGLHHLVVGFVNSSTFDPWIEICSWGECIPKGLPL